jgi:YVTN family beta-propeller protein
VHAQTPESITQNMLRETNEIRVGNNPTDIQINQYTNKIYVANSNSSTVSVIDSNSGNTKYISVGGRPIAIAINAPVDKIYVANELSNSVSVINGYDDRKEKDVLVGIAPLAIAINEFANTIYVANSGSDTVSVINGNNDAKEPDIAVGSKPWTIAYNPSTNMIYVANAGNGTVPGSVSVINPSSDKVVVGVKIKVNPVEGGEIKCNNVQTPPNIYLYVDFGASCSAKASLYYYFDGWVENLTRDSSLPLESDSSALTVKRYGAFTANFKSFPPERPPPPPDYTFLFITVIVVCR